MKKVLSVLITLMLISGCSQKKNLEIEFDTDTFEVHKKKNTCELVSRVNGKPVEEIESKNNTLLSNGNVVHCSVVDMETVGEKTVIYELDGIQTEKTFQLVDTTAPSIHFDQDSISVEEGNEYFKLLDVIKVTDNYDKDFYVGLDGAFDIHQAGEYHVKILAKDSSNNESEKSLVVNVKPKEKEVVTVIEKETVYVQGHGGQSNTSPAPAPSTQKPSQGAKPSNKDFLHSDGYNLNTAYSACLAYAKKVNEKGWGVSCTSIDSADGYSLGMRATIQ